MVVVGGKEWARVISDGLEGLVLFLLAQMFLALGRCSVNILNK